jgi:uncharacterized protein (TIGR02271 family)
MDNNKIRRGMTVYTMDNQSLGTVDDLTDNYFMVGGQQYPLNSGYRVENNNVYLTGGANYTGTNRTGSEMRVPVMEEQLNVEKRQGQLGEVQVHKTVNQEQVNVPVELRREEVNVQQRDVQDRPVSAGDANTAFQEGTIRVPVRGEEAVVNKQAVVTGEVDINKKVTGEKQTISDTVRKEQVRVDDSSAREASGVVRNEGYNRDNMVGNTANTGYATQSDRYQAGTGAAANAAANLREGMDVVGMDGELVGRVKELHDADFRVDRKMKPDIDVTYSAIQNVNGDQVVLNGRAGDFNNLI